MSKVRKYIKYLGWALASLLLLALAARLSLAPLAAGAIENWFESQGIAADIDDLDFELADGRLVLEGLVASVADRRVLALESLEIAWSWNDLRDNRVHIDSVRIDGLDVAVERLQDGGMTIAGLDITAASASAETDAEAPAAAPLDWTLQLPDLRMSNTRLCYRGPPRLDYCNTLATLEWNGSLQVDLARLDDKALPLSVEGDIQLSGFESRNNELQAALATFERFAFEGIDIQTSDDVAVGGITLEALNLFERFDDADGGFIEHIDRLHITDTRLDRGNLLTLAEVLIEGNATEFVKTAADRYEIDAWLAALGQAPAGAADTAPPVEDEAGKAEAGAVTGSRRLGENPDSTADSGSAVVEATTDSAPSTDPEPEPGGRFDYAIGKLVFDSRNPLRYRDLSLGKPFVVGLSSTRLTVDSLDSRTPEQPSDLTYEARLGGDSLFEIAGTVTPLAPKISFDLSGEVRALDLRQLSQFTAASIGHTIKSGQLDADIDLRAEQAIVNGKIELILYRLDLQALSEADAAAMEERFGFPLGPSLALLKNREGNIELKVPLSGDLQNPDFGTGKIISRELSKAITSAVLTFYTPFGLITAADALFSLATALEFEPVTFTGGESELDAGQRGELDKIATLLQERPAIQLRLCPHTNTADRVALLPDTARIAREDIVAQDMPALGELGEARMLAVEKYLADQQIDPARLIHCTATHEEGEGLAGVEITL